MCRVASRPSVRHVDTHARNESHRTDAELLSAHISGDRDAFAELYTRYRPGLSRLAAQRSATPEDAADALQEAMLAVHRGAKAFRHHCAVGSWLYRIVANACVDQHRDRARNSGLRLHDAGSPIIDRTGDLDTALLVRGALLTLPTPQRAAVFAVDVHGLSVAEAAQHLGVPEGTVKSRRARARARLLCTLTPIGD